MEHRARPVEVREVEDGYVDAGQGLDERPDADVVRAVAAPDEQRALVEPEGVAALGRRRRLEPHGDRNACLDEIGRHRVDLTAAALLLGTEQDGSTIGDERRIVDVDRVRCHSDRRPRQDDLRASRSELGAEGLVLGGDSRWVGRGAPAAGAPADRVLGTRRTDEHAPERRRTVFLAACVRTAAGSRNAVGAGDNPAPASHAAVADVEPGQHRLDNSGPSIETHFDRRGQLRELGSWDSRRGVIDVRRRWISSRLMVRVGVDKRVDADLVHAQRQFQLEPAGRSEYLRQS